MRTRGGFTIIELLVALVILGVAVVGIQVAMTNLIHTAAVVDQQSIAAQIAEARLDMISADPSYATLTSRYTEDAVPVPSISGLVRTTHLTQTYDSTDAGVLDYTRITVSVDGPGIGDPVSRTTAIARR